MPHWRDSSFPLLAIARQFNLDYGDVCLYADATIKMRLGQKRTHSEIEVINRLTLEEEADDAIREVALRMPRAKAGVQ